VKAKVIYGLLCRVQRNQVEGGSLQKLERKDGAFSENLIGLCFAL
jgi:hypothetical protein